MEKPTTAAPETTLPSGAPAARDVGAGPSGPPEAETAAPPLRRKYAQPDLRVVVFTMTGYEYVVDLALVQEIIQPTGLMHVDGVPEHVEGVVKRQGRIVPVVDLGKYLGLGVSPPTVETCVIVVRLPVGLVGFMVDSVLELMWVKTRDLKMLSPVVAGMDSMLSGVYLQGVAHLGDRLLAMLDLERVLTPDEQHELSKLDILRPAASHSGEMDAEAAETGQEQARADLPSLVVFELGDELYSVPVTDVAEIREPLAIMPLPHVPPHVLGLINLRGVVVPVIDLRREFGLNLKPDGSDNRLVILKGPGYRVALRVNSVRGLARLPRADFQLAPPGVARIDLEYCDRVITLDGQMLIELNVQKLLADTATGAREPCPEPAKGSPET